MTGGASLEWIWTVAGWTLGGAGLLLALWALFWDRARGRKRCPRCWYDMAGASGLRCSECGREARNEKRLFKTRRRWWWAVAGVFLGLAGYSLGVTPRVQKHGWPAAVPTTAAIAVLPWLAPMEGADATSLGQRGPSGLSGDAWLRARKLLLHDLLERRAANGLMWAWQARWLVQRAVAGVALDHEGTGKANACESALARVIWDGTAREQDLKPLWDRLAPRIVRMRDQWPRGLPLQVRVEGSMWHASSHHRTLIAKPRDHDGQVIRTLINSLGTIVDDFSFRRDATTMLKVHDAGPSDGLLEFDLELWDEGPILEEAMGDHSQRRMIWSGTAVKQIGFADSLGDIMEPVRSDELEEAIRTVVRLVAGEATDEGAPRVFGRVSLADGMRPADMAIGLKIEVLHDGVPTAEAEVWDGPGMAGIRWIFPFTVVGEGMERFDASDSRWAVRVRGDGAVALRDFGAARYWAGEFTLPWADMEKNR